MTKRSSPACDAGIQDPITPEPGECVHHAQARTDDYKRSCQSRRTQIFFQQENAMPACFNSSKWPCRLFSSAPEHFIHLCRANSCTVIVTASTRDNPHRGCTPISLKPVFTVFYWRPSVHWKHRRTALQPRHASTRGKYNIAQSDNVTEFVAAVMS